MRVDCHCESTGFACDQCADNSQIGYWVRLSNARDYRNAMFCEILRQCGNEGFGETKWKEVPDPIVARYRGKVSRIYFRADAGFANLEVYEFLEAERTKYAIRLPANRILQDRIGYLLRRPVGRPPNEVRRFHANFTYQAGSWSKPRRVIAKVEWHPGELYPRVVARQGRGASVGQRVVWWCGSTRAFAPLPIVPDARSSESLSPRSLDLSQGLHAVSCAFVDLSSVEAVRRWLDCRAETD